MCWHEKSNITNTRKSPCFNNIALSLSNAVINMGGSLWSLSNSIWVTMFPGSHLPVKVTCSMAVLKTRVRPKPLNQCQSMRSEYVLGWDHWFPPPKLHLCRPNALFANFFTLCPLFHSFLRPPHSLPSLLRSQGLQQLRGSQAVEMPGSDGRR